LNILDKFIAEKTHQLKPDEFSFLPVASFDFHKTGEERSYTLDANEEYELRLVLACKFWANQAQYRDALKTAKKIMSMGLYSRMNELVHQMEGAIHGGERRKCMEIIDAMKKEIEGE